MGRQGGLVQRRLIVRGRVQGVGFRYYVREYARQLDLSGKVRNLSDGSVEVEAEGLPDAMEKFIAHLERGPDGARVTGVEQNPLEPPSTQLPRPFAIER